MLENHPTLTFHPTCCSSKHAIYTYHRREWRIQDFPGGGRCWGGKGSEKLLFYHFFPKKLHEIENLDRGKGHVPVQWRIQGGRPWRALLRTKIFLISCSFRENLANLCVGAPPPPAGWCSPPTENPGSAPTVPPLDPPIDVLVYNNNSPSLQHVVLLVTCNNSTRVANNLTR